MKKLLKDYGFDHLQQYFDMMTESYINGNLSQAAEQFKALSKEHRKSFVKDLFRERPAATDLQDYFFNLL